VQLLDEYAVLKSLWIFLCSTTPFNHPLPITSHPDTFKVNKKSVKVRHVRIQQVQSWASTFNPNTDFGPLSVEFGFIAVHLDKNNVLAVTGT
jgi:hypothetical protein